LVYLYLFSFAQNSLENHQNANMNKAQIQQVSREFGYPVAYLPDFDFHKLLYDQPRGFSLRPNTIVDRRGGWTPIGIVSH
jgi:hypothetical protein